MRVRALRADRDFVDILSNMSAGERAGVEELSLRGCSSLSDIALSYLRRLPNLLRLDVSFVPGFSPDKFATCASTSLPASPPLPPALTRPAGSSSAASSRASSR
jgi:hypothetical protein